MGKHNETVTLHAMHKVCIDTVFISFIKLLNKTLHVHLMSITFILGFSSYQNTYWEMSKYHKMIKAYSRLAYIENFHFVFWEIFTCGGPPHILIILHVDLVHYFITAQDLQ
jgi:hypothetical protein